jgi:hypothetical protein
VHLDISYCRTNSHARLHMSYYLSLLRTYAVHVMCICASLTTCICACLSVQFVGAYRTIRLSRVCVCAHLLTILSSLTNSLYLILLSYDLSCAICTHPSCSHLSIPSSLLCICTYPFFSHFPTSYLTILLSAMYICTYPTIFHLPISHLTISNISEILSLKYICTHPSVSHLSMRWLCLIGSFKLQVSSAKEPYNRNDILQKTPIILRGLLIVATPYL